MTDLRTAPTTARATTTGLSEDTQRVVSAAKHPDPAWRTDLSYRLLTSSLVVALSSLGTALAWPS